MSDSNVFEDYDRIYSWFDEHRNRELGEPKYLEVLIEKKPRGVVLDLGCGMGEPIAAFLLSRGECVLGVDGSSKLLELAAVRVPDAELVCADMRQYDPGQSVAAVIAWHSLFHLSASDQERMIPKISRWLGAGGIFLFTAGTKRGEVWGDNGGVSLYHASLDKEEYLEILNMSGLDVLMYREEDPEVGGATVWLCQKQVF